MSADKKTFSFVNDLWNDSEVGSLDAVDRLVYRSNKLGADQRITNTGGGNTSSKALERDPLTGESVEVLWVKGSGGDLRTSNASNFSSLYQDKLMGLQKVYASAPERGPKSEAEDSMVGLFNHTNFNLNSRAPSIDTPLHSFVPFRHVDHTHPNAVISVAAARRSKELTDEIYGESIQHLPWLRPGFELGLQMQEVCRQHPEARGIVMGQHGLINWADDDRDCYYRSLELIEQASRFIDEKYQANGGDENAFGGAIHKTFPEDHRDAVLTELLPWLRGQVSGEKRMIATIQTDEKLLRFVNSRDAERLAELGTSCPDHFLRTKIKPLYIPLAADVTGGEISRADFVKILKEKLSAGLENYRADYKAYYENCRHANSPAMRDPNPTVILIPGIGMIAFGKSKSESRVTAEFYNCAVEVMRGAEAIDEYISLPQQEAFDIEYWLLEEAKLQRMPAEKELARQVVVVIGAGSGIGREVAHRVSREGACVVAVDLSLEAAQETASQITQKVGAGIGVAGSGISGCGDAIGLQCNITDRESVQHMFDQAILAYGGFDHVVVTAGIFVPPDTSGHIADDKWALTFAINVTGSYIVADTARDIFNRQGLKGSVVLTTSANAVVAKKGSLAYDVSKSAANHLVRELAIELAPLVRVNGVAPATVVAGSAMFPRDRVISSLAKYNLAYSEDEDTETLRNRLALFYAERTMTREPITPADQAEAFYLLISRRLSKTTGQIIAVDGGLEQAFLR